MAALHSSRWKQLLPQEVLLIAPGELSFLCFKRPENRPFIYIILIILNLIVEIYIS